MDLGFCQPVRKQIDTRLSDMPSATEDLKVPPEVTACRRSFSADLGTTLA